VTWWQRVRRRWRLEEELDDELRFHFDRLVADSRAAGMSEQDAQAHARREFGQVEAIKDDCRDARGTRWVHDVAADLRFAARLVTRERGLTMTALLVLALGLGVNTTLFSIVNAICLRGLPIANPERIVDIARRDAARRLQPLSLAQLDSLRTSRPASLDGVAAYVSRPATLRDDDAAAERVVIGYVTANAFTLIEQRPRLGRDFTLEDDRPGRAAVIVIGGDLWRTRYASDPNVLGRAIIVNGSRVTVVGIMPEGFRFPDNADAWQPLSAISLKREEAALTVYARTADGATTAPARESIVSTLTAGSAQVTGQAADQFAVSPIDTRYRGDITNPAWLAFITAGLLLVIIACSNVANLLIARGTRRRREMAIRLSLGATRGRIVRQLLVEASLLAVLGGILAVGVAAIGLRLFLAAIPPGGLPYWVNTTIDGRVLAMLAVVCCGTALFSTVAPALQLAGRHIAGVVQEQSASVTRRPATARWSTAFLTVQLALSVILLSAVGVTVQTFYAFQHSGPVIDGARILTGVVTLPPETYPSFRERTAFFRRLDERLIGSGLATAVSVASSLPASPGQVRRLSTDSLRASETAPLVRTVGIDDGYFAALGVPLIEGRTFTPEDFRIDARAAIVNRRFADLFLAGRSALGQRITLTPAGGGAPSAADVYTVVGVSPSLRGQPSLEPDPQVYLLGQPGAAPTVMIRAAQDPAALAATVREEIRRLDPAVPVSRMMTLDEANWEGRWNARVSAGLITTIAFIALCLAAVGLAALTAHTVAQRSRELGIRLALGARPGQVLALVLRGVAAQVAIGLFMGILGAIAWERLFTTNRLTAVGNLATVSVLVAAVTLAFAAWPARRAARLDPLTTLRVD